MPCQHAVQESIAGCCTTSTPPACSCAGLWLRLKASSKCWAQRVLSAPVAPAVNCTVLQWTVLRCTDLCTAFSPCRRTSSRTCPRTSSRTCPRTSSHTCPRTSSHTCPRTCHRTSSRTCPRTCRTCNQQRYSQQQQYSLSQLGGGAVGAWSKQHAAAQTPAHHAATAAVHL